MPWSAIAGIGGAALSYFGGQNATDAANAQNAANLAAQERWNWLQDPFSMGGNRAQYVSQLNDLMRGGYQGMQQDPMFQWMMSQGKDQAQRAGSASGRGGSGAEQIALQQQGFGLSQDFFNQQFSRLAELSGASRGGGQAAIGQSPTNVYNMGMGNAMNQGAALGLGMQSLGKLFGNLSSGYRGNPNMSSSGEYIGDPYFGR